MQRDRDAFGKRDLCASCVLATDNLRGPCGHARLRHRGRSESLLADVLTDP
jgi:hypothetical protein